MNFNYIVKKLVMKNIKEYLVVIFGIALAVFVISVLGMVILSPSVSNVFYPGGTSQQFAYGMYALNIISCTVFIVFIQTLFMRYKSKEIGVFLSLGIKKRDISRLIKKELLYLVILGMMIGIILSIPGAIFSWNALAFFFHNEESKFIIGWTGIIMGLVFSLFSYFILRFITGKYIKKVDIIKILHSTSENEIVVLGKPILGMTGWFCIPIGIIFMFLGLETSHPIIKHLFEIGLIVNIIGIYLFSTQISTLGSVFKKYNKNRYFRNIVFFNLLKLKGKQFVLSLFIGTILTAIGLFSLFLNVGPAIESFETIKNAQYDFGYLQVLTSKQLDESNIEKLAAKNGLNVLNYQELDGFFLTPYNLLTDLSPDWYWSEDAPFISETTFNNIFNENIEVLQGKYVIAVNYNKLTDFSNETLRPRYNMKFFNASNNQEIKITADKTIEINEKMVNSELFKGMMSVLDDSDYNEIDKEIDTKYKFKYKSFNVDKFDESLEFSNELFDEYLKIHNYQFPQHFSTRGLDQINAAVITEKEIEKITPEVKRNWALMPYSRIDKQVNQVDDGVVYILVFGIVSLFCFVASGLIIGIKILSSMWEEKRLFKNLSFLGCKKDYIKSIIRKQVFLLYVFPNILASIIILSLYTIVYKADMLYSDKIIFISYGITLLIIGFSILMAIIISNKIQKKCINFINGN